MAQGPEPAVPEPEPRTPLPESPASPPAAGAEAASRIAMPWWVVPFVVVCGGVLGVLGAVIQEWRSFDLLGPFVSGPVIEEATKPAGVYILLVRRPLSVSGRRTKALLSACAGTAFGVVESAVYVLVYVDDPSAGYVVFRFTVPVVLHTLTGLIFGLGITDRLMRSVRGEVPFLSGSWPFFITAVAIHSAYNVGATLLELTGTLRFD